MTNSSVSVVNDQSGYARNTYPPLQYVDPGNSSNVTTIEGKMIFDCPEDYNGPDIYDLTYSFGYGSLSAGHIDATLGDKTFGTLGQGTAEQNYMYGGGIVNTWDYADLNYT
jgi:hypothetical protein